MVMIDAVALPWNVWKMILTFSWCISADLSLSIALRRPFGHHMPNKHHTCGLEESVEKQRPEDLMRDEEGFAEQGCRCSTSSNCICFETAIRLFMDFFSEYFLFSSWDRSLIPSNDRCRRARISFLSPIAASLFHSFCSFCKANSNQEIHGLHTHKSTDSSTWVCSWCSQLPWRNGNAHPVCPPHRSFLWYRSLLPDQLGTRKGNYWPSQSTPLLHKQRHIQTRHAHPNPKRKPDFWYKP